MKDDYKSLLNQGVDQFQKGNYLKSETIFKNILYKNSRNYDLFTYLIPSLINQNKLNEAQKYSLKFFDVSVKHRNTSLIYLGIISQMLDRLTESADYFQQSLKIDPNNYHALTNLGLTYHKLKDNQKAIRYTRKSIEVNKNNSLAYQNIASFLEDENKIDEAIEYLKQAVSINNKDHDSLHALSLLQLLELDYNNGLQNYEQRFFSTFQKLKYTNIAKLIKNTKVKGKKILIWHEQGLGDTIQFSRLANNLFDLGGVITLEVQKPLEKFLSNQFNFKVSNKIEDQQFDFQIPLLSLLSYFDINPKNIPNFQNYFKSDEKKFLFWKTKLPIAKDKLNIGLSISGNKKHKKEYRRNIPLEKFIPFTEQFRIFLVQKEITKEESSIIQQNQEMFFLGDDPNWEDFTDTSAIVENMDFIVSIDTSLIHLSGSMNKKSYLLLSNPPDWRWGYDVHNELNWYDSVHIIRQKFSGNWDDVFERLSLILKEINL